MEDYNLECTLEEMMNSECLCACGSYCVTSAQCAKFFGVPSVESQVAISYGAIRGYSPYDKA